MSNEILQEYYRIIKNKIISAGFHSAIANIHKLLANFPDDSYAYYYMGVCNFALERYDESMASYLKAISLDITNAKAYFNLGIVYYLQNDFDNALINIGKSLVLFSKQKELNCKQRCIDALNFIQRERKTL